MNDEVPEEDRVEFIDRQPGDMKPTVIARASFEEGGIPPLLPVIGGGSALRGVPCGGFVRYWAFQAMPGIEGPKKIRAAHAEGGWYSATGAVGEIPPRQACTDGEPGCTAIATWLLERTGEQGDRLSTAYCDEHAPDLLRQMDTA
jgi:hypothetical protein